MSADYEHAGEWECELCGESFGVESKTDIAMHALTCPGESSGTRSGGHDGYQRRKQELEAAYRGEDSA